MVETLSNPDANGGFPAEQSEISLIDLLTAVGREKKTIALMTLVCGAIGVAAAFLMTPIYTAKTTLLPPQQGQNSTSAVAASLGALAGAAGIGGALKTPEELYVGLLKTDSIANDLIARFKLKERYEEKTLLETRTELAKNARATGDRKSTLITVEVDDWDPVFSAELANGYADELRKLMTRIAVTEAQQRRLFFEQQMEKAKSDVIRAELAVKQAQDKSGVISLDAQTQSTISAAAQIRGQIVAREVQLQATRPYAGPENQDLKRLLSELGSLRNQLARIEGGGPDLPAHAAKDNTEALANVRIFRELKYQEAIYSAMLQQYQLAKADEARDAPLVQQVDVALPPDRKSKPRRALIVLGALVFGLVLGLAAAFLRNMRRSMDPASETAQQWRALATAWSFRRGKHNSA